MNRVMARDQYGGVRFRPHLGTQDALQAIKALADHPIYGRWATRAEDEHHGQLHRIRRH